MPADLPTLASPTRCNPHPAPHCNHIFFAPPLVLRGSVAHSRPTSPMSTRPDSPRGSPRLPRVARTARGGANPGSTNSRFLRAGSRGRPRGGLSPTFTPTYNAPASPKSPTASFASKTADTAAAPAAAPSTLPDGPVAFLGAGNMARALIRGLLARGLDPALLRASARTEGTLSKLRNHLFDDALHTSNADAVCNAAVVVVCVKPAQVSAVLREVAESLAPSAALVSVAAGVTLADLRAALGDARPDVTLVRAMPNVGAQALRGVTGLCAAAEPPDSVKAVFAACGGVHVVEERLLPALTAISGCGIAYCLMLAEALADAGVRHGLPRDIARALAAATVEGAGALAVARPDAHFALMRNEIESPGGVTIAATAALERGGFRAAALDAVDGAIERQRELDK